jgi:hypothetical protein
MEEDPLVGIVDEDSEPIPGYLNRAKGVYVVNQTKPHS